MTVFYRLASVAALAVLASCSGTRQPAAAPPQVAAVAASLPAEGSLTAPAAAAEDAAAAAAPPQAAAANTATGLPAQPAAAATAAASVAAAPPQATASAATGLGAEGSPTAPATPAADSAAATAPPEAAVNATAGLPAQAAQPVAAAPVAAAPAAAKPAEAAVAATPPQAADTPPQAPPAAAGTAAAPAGQAAASGAGKATGPEKGKDSDTYVIGSGDQLNVFVYNSPQLSMTVPVRPDGRISTPLVPEMMAAGKTPSQLAQDLTERLKEFIKEPNVTVIVSGFVGPLNRQIRVIGEAAEPQAIPYRDHMTVLDVMIMAKGLTRFAAGNRAVIVRGEGEKQERIRVRLSDLLKEGDISQNVEMRPGDTLIIPQTWF